MTVASAAVGFYVHHDGAGHAARAAAVIEAVRAQAPDVRVSVASSAEPPGLAGEDRWPLPPDVDGGPQPDRDAGGALHHAPLRADLLGPRARAVLRWLDECRPDVVVVDVSVEVAVLVRLAGVPVVVVRLHGRRNDPPHELAHRLASHILVPHSRAVDGDVGDPSLAPKTTWCGCIGSGPPSPARRRPGSGRCRALVLWGAGTPPPPGPNLDHIALANPGWDWVMAGPPSDVRPPTIVDHRGWVDDPWPLLAEADVLIGPPGNGVVSMVARTGIPFVAVPQPRPFHEQASHALALERLGIAVASARWPAPAAWPALLEAALTLPPERVAVLESVGAADRAATSILAVAAQARAEAAVS